ncbi:MAG TPA: ABC transporter ATP-binding protein [Planctomycetaceae bacterium]|nr:ABC transporter ATP-binding protein [Planctomycetaceae bacterium]
MTDLAQPVPSPAIQVQGLTKYYDGKAVVNNVSFQIPTGCVFGFLGCNGAGKSTTTKMLMGMVVPDAGSAKLLGHDVSSLDPQVRERIAYIAEGHPLYSWMSIREAIRFTKPFYKKWNQELLEQVLEHFGLPLTRKIRRLSKGQQAQVSLALAIAPQPELLILDDPTLGLDTVVRREFLESMIQIIQREGRTIMFSSHILGDVERVADRIGIMVDGRLQVDCTTEEFKQSVSKLVLEFDRPVNGSIVFPECKGVVGSRSILNQLEVIVVNLNDEHRLLAERLEPKQIETESMNLEDSFLEYTRTNRKSVPVFVDQLKSHS